MVRKVLVIILNLSIFTACTFAQSSIVTQLDLFGVQLDFNQNEIVEVLQSQRETKVIRRPGLDSLLCTIEPETQNIPEGENLDFVLSYFDDSLLSLRYFYKEIHLYEKLQSTFGEPALYEVFDEYTIIEWEIESWTVTCYYYIEKNLLTYIFYNNAVYEDFKSWESSQDFYSAM